MYYYLVEGRGYKIKTREQIENVKDKDARVIVSVAELDYQTVCNLMDEDARAEVTKQPRTIPSVRQWLDVADSSIFCDECGEWITEAEMTHSNHKQKWGESWTIHCPQGHALSGGIGHLTGEAARMADKLQREPDSTRTRGGTGDTGMGGVYR